MEEYSVITVFKKPSTGTFLPNNNIFTKMLNIQSQRIFCTIITFHTGPSLTDTYNFLCILTTCNFEADLYCKVECGRNFLFMVKAQIWPILHLKTQWRLFRGKLHKMQYEQAVGNGALPYIYNWHASRPITDFKKNSR